MPCKVCRLLQVCDKADASTELVEIDAALREEVKAVTELKASFYMYSVFFVRSSLILE